MAITFDNVILSNDAVGTEYFELSFPLVISGGTETSTGGRSGGASALVPVMQAPWAGRIVDYGYGVTQLAVSASGYVSGTTTAGIFINGNPIMSASGALNMWAASTSATATARQFVNTLTTSTAQFNPPQLNNQSTGFNQGDQISFNFNQVSAGSAAAGQTTTGFYGYVKLRRTAQ